MKKIINSSKVLKSLTLIVTLILIVAACSDTIEQTIQDAGSNWKNIAQQNEKHIFIIGILVSNGNHDDDLLFEVGTAFRLRGGKYFTNAHVVIALEYFSANHIPTWLEDYFGPLYSAKFVISGSGESINESHELDKYLIHSYYNLSAHCPDLAEIWLKNDPGITEGIKLADSSEISNLQVGQEIATFGFPGELQYYNYMYPRATFKTGVISSLRPFDFPFEPNGEDYFIEYNFNLTGGTSGSPVFNTSGNLIAVHNSGYTNGSIDHGIRSDILNDFDSVYIKNDFSPPVLDLSVFYIVPGESIGQVALGAPVTGLPSYIYSETIGNVRILTDDISYELQAVLDPSNNVILIRLYDIGTAFDSPFHTELSYIGIGSPLYKISNYYNPDEIEITDDEINSETRRVTHIKSQGISFLHDPYNSYIEEIFIYDKDSTLVYSGFLF